MTWLTVWHVLRSHWEKVAILLVCIGFSLFVYEFLDRGSDIARLEGVNTALRTQIDQYRENAVKAEDLRREVRICLDRVEDAQAEAAEWQRRYEEAERKPTRTIRVPVEVSAPGTACDEAVVQVAGWLAGEVSP